MNCPNPNCRNPLQTNEVFCPACGTRVRNGDRNPVPIPPPHNPYTTVPESQLPPPQVNPDQTLLPHVNSPQPPSPRINPDQTMLPHVNSPISPPPPVTLPQQRTRGRNPRLLIFVIVLISIVLISVLYLAFYVVPPRLPGPSPSPTPMPTSSLPISGSMIIKAPDGEYIGISNGTFVFDVNRPDGNLKRQAADKLKAGEIADAESLWKQALLQDTNDAETLIYQEDQSILDSHRSYFTLVIGTILTNKFFSTGRDSLQGAYIAQKEYNDSCSKLPDCVQLRLLVANSGTGDTPSAEVAYTSFVMEQIVQAAKSSDKSIVGVMGWSVSSSSFYMATVLGAAHIPMVSPTASVDAPTQISSYFFRVAPSNKDQAMAGAQYAEQTLHARHVVLFVDPVDKYSESLANDFQQQFTAVAGNTIVAIENYTVGKPDTVASHLSDALSNNPDLIYFAGHTIDIGALLTNLPTAGLSANLQVLGGDGLYEVGGYPADVRGKLYRLHFTAFAYPDEWHFLAPSEQQPTFFSDYPQAFDPQGQHLGDYGYGRADNSTILSYDALQELLTASTLAFDGGKPSFTTDELQQALAHLQAVQGVSGQIVFGPDGDPINKTVIVLHFDLNNHIQFDQAYGCFLKQQPTTSPNTNCS